MVLYNKRVKTKQNKTTKPPPLGQGSFCFPAHVHGRDQQSDWGQAEPGRVRTANSFHCWLHDLCLFWLFLSLRGKHPSSEFLSWLFQIWMSAESSVLKQKGLTLPSESTEHQVRVSRWSHTVQNWWFEQKKKKIIWLDGFNFCFIGSVLFIVFNLPGQDTFLVKINYQPKIKTRTSQVKGLHQCCDGFDSYRRTFILKS